MATGKGKPKTGSDRPKTGTKGGPKTPGSGRKKGTRNKVTQEISGAIRELLESNGKNEAIQGILDLARHAENETVRLRAYQDLVDRGYGKATQRTELTGKDGADLLPVEIIQLPDNGRGSS